jgi:DNA modification methylase
MKAKYKKSVDEIKETIRDAREFREEFIKEYGEVPTSIWKIDYSQNSFMYDPRGRKVENNRAMLEKSGMTDLNAEMGNAFGMRWRNIRGKEGKDVHSILPYDLMNRVIRFYSKKGDKVLDPTMGDMAAQTVTIHLGRSFVGYDVSEKNYKINEEVRDMLMGVGEQKLLSDIKPDITLHFQSSEHILEGENTIDLVFFSPPYWDIEFYGEEAQQLGYKKSYPEFLKGLGKIISECFRVLKPGKFIVININDFRKGGLFYAYHVDVYNLLRKSGFLIHDCIIIDWGSCFGQCFARRIEETKTTAKKHEYLWIAKKPNGEELSTEMDDEVLEKEEIILEEVEKEIIPEINIPEEDITSLINKYEGMISREKAIEILKQG